MLLGRNPNTRSARIEPEELALEGTTLPDAILAEAARGLPSSGRCGWCLVVSFASDAGGERKGAGRPGRVLQEEGQGARAGELQKGR